MGFGTLGQRLTTMIHPMCEAEQMMGDHLDIDFTPANYTPDTTPSEAANVDDLAAHLAGIDNALRATVYGGVE